MIRWRVWTTSLRLASVCGLAVLIGCEAGVLSGSGTSSFGQDAGVVADAGPVRFDAGTRDPADAGSLFDGGQGGQDAGSPDVGFDAGPPDSGPPPDPACESPIEAEVRRLANEARGSAGPLACDPNLAAAARGHAQDMCDRGYFSHTSQDGRSFTDRLDEAGATYRTAGENIAWGQRGPSEVHTSWMNSAGHRRNIMNTSFGRIGVGHVDCGGRPHWVQNFAD